MGNSATVPPREPGEVWRPVLGYEDLYQVSSLGRLWGSALWRGTRGRLLTLTPHPADGYFKVMLYKDGTRRPRLLHALVAEAFHGPRPPGQVVRHLDGVRTNNVSANLTWGTCQENSDDKMRHGNFAGPAADNAVKIRCIHGHGFTPANTYITRQGQRQCRACKREEKRRRRARAAREGRKAS